MISKSPVDNAASDSPSSTELANLTAEIRELRSRVDLLCSLLDPEEMAAALEIVRTTPTRDELQFIALHSEPQTGMTDVEEEKPW